MTDFTIHTKDNAPENSKQLLDKAEKAVGFIPNLFGVMAASPQLLEAYLTLDNLAKNLSLNSTEVTVVWQTINSTNQCHYCIPAHTAIAKQMKVSDRVNDAVINDKSLEDNKLEALRSFTKAIIQKQGKVDEVGVDKFLSAGYTQKQILEVVMLVGQKTLSNYTNYFAQTPIDAQFK
ncbi:carboxymuconolactone decarboxylase family protein [Aliidiomarina halalkaliphila]|uniref:Carboxymuconolactone decarboxylase family protein n=1 Tax=Aliidiomarina halalkaliphila TaxID=2593535 RepID=A0A552WYQ2_9GAMM|nr:carboxymuconolactone decarboxylase family protein [Aliidiomarina halalkaliphila]TRW47917.1 carboxymuconolactone decarboxylase family protein [Aliidiomarina halalkaliphila]